MKNNTYIENLTDWVLNCADDPNPNHAQFSAVDVAYLILKFNKDKLSGKIKFK